MRLPEWLAPGRMVVGHVELGEGRFAFTLDLVHPWFGEMIHQLAVFAEGEQVGQIPAGMQAGVEAILRADLVAGTRAKGSLGHGDFEGGQESPGPAKLLPRIFQQDQ